MLASRRHHPDDRPVPADQSRQEPITRPAGFDEGFIVSEFKREVRYTVIKHNQLTDAQMGFLKNCIYGEGIPTVACVVIEVDWPEYEPVWQMIEDRVNGRPVLDHNSCHSSIRKQVDAIDSAQSELAALREELAKAAHMRTFWAESAAKLDKHLTAAEQRNATCNAEIVAMVESALRRSFSLGQVYWQQADSDSTCQQNKSDQTIEVQAQHILNVIKSINDLIKPTESGASE